MGGREESKHNMSDTPIISVIIPVLKEHERINNLINHIRALSFDTKVEIIVVDGDPQWETLKVIRDAEVVRIESVKGRGKQMNEGAGYANGDIILFLHADTELPQNAIMLIKSAMKNKKYVAGAFNLGIKSDRPVFRLIEYFASLRSRITRTPFGDQAIFIRKSYFDRIGGYKDIPLMEDVELMKRIKKRGDKIIIIKERAATSPRRWEKEGILRCTLRNWFLQMLYGLGVSPYKLTKYYGYKYY